MNQEQLEYVKKQLHNGVPADQVRENLLGAGYTPELVEELFQAAESGVDTPPAPTTESSLPGIGAFLQGSWAVVKQRPDVTWPAVVIVTAIAAVLPAMEMVMSPGVGTNLMIAIASLLSSIISIMLFIAILRVFFSDTSISLGDAFRWACSNFLSYLWVAVLMMLLTLGGLMIFVIPGLILSIYLMLAPVVWLREDVRGMNALVRSTTLIQGHWWAVFFRYFVFVLSAGLLMLLAGLVLGILGGLTGLMPASEMSQAMDATTSWFDVLIAPISGIVLVASAGALFQIYQGLKGTKPAFVPGQYSGLRTFYIIAASLAPFVIVLMSILILWPIMAGYMILNSGM